MASHVRAPWIVGTVRYRCTMAWLTPYTDIQVKYVPMVTPNTVCRSAGSGFMLQRGCRAQVAALFPTKGHPRTHIGLRCLVWPTFSAFRGTSVPLPREEIHEQYAVAAHVVIRSQHIYPSARCDVLPSVFLSHISFGLER